MTGVEQLRFTGRLLPALVAVAVVACGDAEQAPEPGAPSGRLVVEKSLAGLPIFIEGSTTQLRIIGEDGADVLNGPFPVDTLDMPLVDRPVPAGTYELTAVERPCAGNCSMLDPPADTTRCALEVVVEANRTTRVAIVLSDTPAGGDSDCSAKTAGPSDGRQ
jgi:hypothetical protein